jgi:glucokinase
MSVLVADIGGTNIKLGIVVHGRVVARDEIAANAEQGLQPALVRIADRWRRLCAANDIEVNSLARIGLAFPGLVDPRTGRILSSPVGKFDDAPVLDLDRWSREQFALPLTIANDANAALAGEWRYGAANGCRSAVMMTLGTGIGTSAIIDGTPLRGEHGQAGNLGGHFVLSLSGRACPCGNVGCAEAEASGWATAQLAREDGEFFRSGLAREPSVDLAAIFRLATAGDRLARRLRDHCIRVWAGLAVTLVHAYDPNMLIIGGGVMGSAETILPAIQEHLDRHAWTPWGHVRAVPAALGNDAGLLGIGYLSEHS